MGNVDLQRRSRAIRSSYINCPVFLFYLQGFGYLGFIVDDLEVACKRLAEKGARKIPEPEAFAGKLARFEDPDGYHVQLALRKAVVE